MFRILNNVRNALLRPFDYSSIIEPVAYALSVLALLFFFLTISVETSPAVDGGTSIQFGFNISVQYEVSTQNGPLIFAKDALWIIAQINVLLCFIAVSFRKLSTKSPRKTVLFFGLCFTTIAVSFLICVVVYALGYPLKLNAVKIATLLIVVSYLVWNSRLIEAGLMAGLSASLFALVLSDFSRQDFDTGVEAYNSKNYQTAFEIFEPFALDGMVEAQAYLALMYDEGLGIEENNDQAMIWYRLAAAQNHAMAQNNIGTMYMHGEGVPKDIEKASEFFRQAADQGYATAQNNLGVIMALGQTGNQDEIEAHRLFRLAAVQGDQLAQRNLGIILTEGKGIRRDNITALMWFSISAENGDKTAEKRRKALKEEMTLLDVSSAKTRAVKCLETNYVEC